MNAGRRATVCLLSLVLLAVSHIPAGADESLETYLSSLPTVRAVIGGERFLLWVAQSHGERARGLKGVTETLLEPTEAGERRGMLFVFPDETVKSFWMEDTPIALDIAFIDGNWRVESIRTMRPETLTAHASEGPVRYAVEVPAGLLERLDVGAGDRVRILFPGLPPGQAGKSQ